MKKSLILLLIAAQLIATASCGGQTENVDTDTSTTGSTAPETTSFYDNIDIPDFSGQSFTILARTDLIDEM